MMVDKKASTQWDKADISYKNYIRYIARKTDRFELSLTDLLYVRNFKGGNASIHEDETSVNAKLKKYSASLRAMHKTFGSRQLADLGPKELAGLKGEAESFVRLSLTASTAIDGFKRSLASALLHFHFPNLIPILDRRALNGTGISVQKNSQGQVVNIERYYPVLIEKFHVYLRNNPTRSIRDYDRQCFTQPIKDKQIGSVR